MTDKSATPNLDAVLPSFAGDKNVLPLLMDEFGPLADPLEDDMITLMNAVLDHSPASFERLIQLHIQITKNESAISSFLQEHPLFDRFIKTFCDAVQKDYERYRESHPPETQDKSLLDFYEEGLIKAGLGPNEANTIGTTYERILAADARIDTDNWNYSRDTRLKLISRKASDAAMENVGDSDVEKFYEEFTRLGESAAERIRKALPGDFGLEANRICENVQTAIADDRKAMTEPTEEKHR